MKDLKLKELINKLLIAIIIILVVTNMYFYGKSKELKNNADYARNFASAISIAAYHNDYGFLTQVLDPGNPEDLLIKFDELKAKIGTQYTMDNYVLIDYHDNNKLVIKTIEDVEGKVYIRDMFLLDK